MEILEDNILSEGDVHCGDLLDAVVKVNKDFWESNPKYKNDLEYILEKSIKELEFKLGSFRQRLI